MDTKQLSLKAFESVLIENANTKTKILFKDLWEKSEKKLIMIHWLRRFGWSLCMMGASDLNESVAKLNNEYNNSLDFATIGLSYLDYDIFEKNNYISNGKVYIDEGKESYKLMDYKSKGILSGYGMLNPKVYINAYKAKNKGFKGNLEGDGYQLGGTVIIDTKGGIVFSHRQTGYSDYPKEEDIIKALDHYKVKNLI